MNGGLGKFFAETVSDSSNYLYSNTYYNQIFFFLQAPRHLEFSLAGIWKGFLVACGKRVDRGNSCWGENWSFAVTVKVGVVRIQSTSESWQLEQHMSNLCGAWISGFGRGEKSLSVKC